jgi:hypothetical protein
VAELHRISTPLMDASKDFMKKVQVAQAGLEGIASRYGEDYRLYKAILQFFEALMEYDPYSLRDNMEMLPYNDSERDFLFRTVEPAFIKLVLVYDEFKARKQLRGVL